LILRPEILKPRSPVTDLRASRTEEHAVAAGPIRVDRVDMALHAREGAVVPAFGAGGNVVPFVPKRDVNSAPAVVLAAGDRPIPGRAVRDGRARIAALLAASMLAHGTLYAAFDQAPPPLTSIGEVAISVEIVLGSEHAAGLAEIPTETEAPDSAASAPSQSAQASSPVEEPVRKAEQVPEPVREPPKVEELRSEPKLAAFIETPRPPESKPPIEEKVEESKPVEQATLPDTKPEEPAVAELAIEQPKPAEEKPRETKSAEIPRPEPEPVKPPEPAATAPEKPQEIPPPPPPPEQQAKPVQQHPAPTPQPERSKETPSRAAAASVASTSSSGIGRGRSDIDSNYRGLVAAHLARHKRFPEDIRRRRQQGSTLVTFAIDGSGKVTTIALAKSSGNTSIDEASQEMIRRASPFPAPPKGQPMSFSVPVSFEIR
jgi:protein TonB